jgi:hypothetical protein
MNFRKDRYIPAGFFRFDGGSQPRQTSADDEDVVRKEFHFKPSNLKSLSTYLSSPTLYRPLNLRGERGRYRRGMLPTRKPQEPEFLEKIDIRDNE